MEERRKLVIRGPQAAAPEPHLTSQKPLSSTRTITLPMRLFVAVCSGVVLALITLLFLFLNSRRKQSPNDPADQSSTGNAGTSSPAGTHTPAFDLSKYNPEKDVLGQDMPLGDYLKQQEIPEPVVVSLTEQAADKGLERLEKGHEVMTLHPINGNSEDRLFAYEISANKTMFFELNPLPRVDVKLRQVETRERAAGGIIKTSLWEAILDYNIHYRVLEQMESAMKWSVDFYHLEPGDRFKVIYEEKRAGSEVIGIGKLKAVYFKTRYKQHYAFWVDDVEKPGYYDDAGRPVQKAFLKCPVKYERITSYFDPARLHPVTGVVQPHKGTDFAAPHGSPIFAVADGAVEKVEFSNNNGNFVKIRHDFQYETQYLHMERFEPGIRPGSVVKQGQVIGYVGQTGLATGPHVCFRFWKNGEQVDPREEPENKPFFMSMKDSERYLKIKNACGQQLREIVYFDGRL
jgi:murein DD-endopeptidase MepM/ murein hydrolase activator NlpD